MGTQRHAKRGRPNGPLRRGWTTGACATAAAKSALHRVLFGTFLDPVEITLPKGQTPAFPLACENWNAATSSASCGVIKDAGDDPDATHGVTVHASVSAHSGDGIRFEAGEGIGTVTREGLPLAVGEPAINPVPRSMIERELRELSERANAKFAWTVEIAIPGGATIANDTWNPRLGIIGGLSILGTTGIVNPYSCAAWIHSIHRGIDVARAAACEHVVASTGSTSEAAAAAMLDLPPYAYLDMGDFAGGLLKYLRAHPIPRLTIAGGIGKLTKLAQGALDLHSTRSEVDTAWLAAHAPTPNVRDRVSSTQSAGEAMNAAGSDAPVLAQAVANGARHTSLGVLGESGVAVDIIVVDRAGAVLATTIPR